MNALEKYAAKQLLIEKLAQRPTSTVSKVLSGVQDLYKKSPVKLNISHTSDPSKSLRLAPMPRSGDPYTKGQGAVDNLQRLFLNKRLSRHGLTWRDAMKQPSMTNIGGSAGPLKVGTTLRGGKPSSLNLGWGGKLAKNIRGNVGVQLPVGPDRNLRKPFFTGNIGGTF